MEIYENLLSMEISRITQEHDAFLSNLLFDQDDDFHSENISFSGVHDKNANINHNIDMKWKTKRQKGKTGNKNRRSTSDIGEPAAIYMENNEKVRTCQDMSGVLGMLLEILTLINLNIKWYVRNTNKCKISIFFSGGTNAFHFLSFVAGVLTLIVNVNNNINNNNVNVNGINANANSNQNSDANVNNNAANVIMVMPGKKRKKK